MLKQLGIFGFLRRDREARRLLDDGNSIMRRRLERIRPVESIGGACDFVLQWSGHAERNCSGQLLFLDYEVPGAIRTLYEWLGDVWRPEHQTFSAPSSFDGNRRCPMFYMQNAIYDPNEYEPDDYGVVRVISENQHLYEVGFHRDHPEKTLLRFEGVDDDDDEWRWQATEIPIEQLLIAELLQNFFHLCRARDDFFPAFEQFVFAGAFDLASPVWSESARPSAKELQKFSPYLTAHQLSYNSFVPLESQKKSAFTQGAG